MATARTTESSKSVESVLTEKLEKMLEDLNALIPGYFNPVWFAFVLKLKTPESTLANRLMSHKAFFDMLKLCIFIAIKAFSTYDESAVRPDLLKQINSELQVGIKKYTKHFKIIVDNAQSNSQEQLNCFNLLVSRTSLLESINAYSYVNRIPDLILAADEVCMVLMNNIKTINMLIKSLQKKEINVLTRLQEFDTHVSLLCFNQASFEGIKKRMAEDTDTSIAKKQVARGFFEIVKDVGKCHLSILNSLALIHMPQDVIVDQLVTPEGASQTKYKKLFDMPVACKEWVDQDKFNDAVSQYFFVGADNVGVIIDNFQKMLTSAESHRQILNEELILMMPELQVSKLKKQIDDLRKDPIVVMMACDYSIQEEKLDRIDYEKDLELTKVLISLVKQNQAMIQADYQQINSSGTATKNFEKRKRSLGQISLQIDNLKIEHIEYSLENVNAVALVKASAEKLNYELMKCKETFDAEVAHRQQTALGLQRVEQRKLLREQQEQHAKELARLSELKKLNETESTSTHDTGTESLNLTITVEEEQSESAIEIIPNDSRQDSKAEMDEPTFSTLPEETMQAPVSPVVTAVAVDPETIATIEIAADNQNSTASIVPPENTAQQAATNMPTNSTQIITTGLPVILRTPPQLKDLPIGIGRTVYQSGQYSLFQLWNDRKAFDVADMTKTLFSDRPTEPIEATITRLLLQ